VRIPQTKPGRSDERIKLTAASAVEGDEGAAPLIGESAPAKPSVIEPEQGVAPEFLKTLPQPPDQPRSLFLPAPPLGPPPPDLEQPYFQLDPILDPPQWGQMGWYWDVQVAGIQPHVQNEMFQVLTTGLGKSVPVALGNTELSLTVAPRIELGYRLPAGFGEFSIADTGFTSNGADTWSGPDGPASRSSALQMNYTDLDYHSREYAPYACWGMRWRAGMRIAESFTTTSFSQPFAQAAAGSGVIAAQQSNATLGFGPHFAVELEHAFARSGFSLVGKVDIADTYTTIRQRYSAVTTTPIAPGIADSGVLIDRFTNQIPILTVQIGLAWQPANYPNTRLYLGYLDQTWWNVMHNPNILSLGQFDYQGVFLRASWNY
jgi:hypothetical protein